MKKPTFKGHTFVSTYLLALSLTAHSQALYWNPIDDSWDTTSDNWESGLGTANFVVWDNTGASEAIFQLTDTLVIADGGVTVGDLTIEDGVGKITLQAATDNDGSANIVAGGATWDLGGGELEFVGNQANDTRLEIASGDTLTIIGEGTFDTGEKPNGAAWTAAGATLDITSTAALRGNAASVGQFENVRLADGSTFIHERNVGQSYTNNWELVSGTVTFGNRYSRQAVLNGIVSGDGTLRAVDLGGLYVQLNNSSNSFTGGVIVDSTNNRSELLVLSDDSRFGAVPATFDPDNIRLVSNGELRINGVDLNANRGITLDNGGIIINSGSPNSYAGTITGSGPLQIGRTQGGDGNTLLLNSDTHDYTGGTVIAQGSVTLGIDEALPTGVLTIGGSGSSRLALNGFTQTVTGLTTAGNNTRQIVNDITGLAPDAPANKGTLILDIADDPESDLEYTFNSAIGFNSTSSTGDLNLVKNGDGTILLGIVTISGDISADSGSLILGNQAGSSIANDVTVADGASLTLDEASQFNSLTAAAGSATTFNWQVSDWTGAAGTGYTQLAIADTLTIDPAAASVTIVVEESALANFTESDASFVVASVGGTSSIGIAEIALDTSNFTSGNGTWEAVVDGNNIVLEYTAGTGSSPYTAWAAGFPTLTGGFFDDDDNDGLANGLEYYFFNSDPTVAEGLPSPFTAVSATDSSDLSFTHDRPVDDTGILETYEWSTTLDGDWTASGVENNGLTVTIAPGTPVAAATGYETVTVSTTTTPATPEKLFIRLNVTTQ